MADLVSQLVPVGAALAGVALAELLRRGNDRRVDARERRARLYSERRQLYARVVELTHEMDRWTEWWQWYRDRATTLNMLLAELSLLGSTEVLVALNDVQAAISPYTSALEKLKKERAQGSSSIEQGFAGYGPEGGPPQVQAKDALRHSIARLTAAMREDLGVD
jgi:hypothetical protein